MGGADICRAWVDVGAGLGHGLGRRSPQASRARRPRGRSAQPARRARQRPPGAVARACRMAARDPGPGRLEALCRRAVRGSGDARIGRRFPLLAALSLLVPTVAGFVLDGFTAAGAVRGLVWGGLVRIFFVHHITWSVNSVCHFFGSRRFDVEDHSTNVGWLALFSLGESWHHNHHAFPRSAFHGLRWWELDLSGMIIVRWSASGWPGTWFGSRPSASARGRSRAPRPARRADCHQAASARSTQPAQTPEITSSAPSTLNPVDPAARMRAPAAPRHRGRRHGRTLRHTRCWWGSVRPS